MLCNYIFWCMYYINQRVYFNFHRVLTRMTLLMVMPAGKLRIQLTGSQLASTSTIGRCDLPPLTILTLVSPADGGRVCLFPSYTDITWTSYCVELLPGTQLQIVLGCLLLYCGLPMAVLELIFIRHPNASAIKEKVSVRVNTHLRTSLREPDAWIYRPLRVNTQRACSKDSAQTDANETDIGSFSRYSVAWTVCKTSEHNVTLEIDVILPLPHDACCGKKYCYRNINFSQKKTAMSHEENFNFNVIKCVNLLMHQQKKALRGQGWHVGARVIGARPCSAQ